MWVKIKGWLLWVYEWITVLTASILGALTMVIDSLASLGAADLTPFLGADKALKIVATVALVKAALAYIGKRRKAV